MFTNKLKKILNWIYVALVMTVVTTLIIAVCIPLLPLIIIISLSSHTRSDLDY